MGADGLFELRILRHGWLDGLDAATDLCSHDRLSVVLGGEELAPPDSEFSASMGGFNLLRSLGDADVAEANRWRGATDYLLPHGCGYPISLGCPNFGIHWVAEHADGTTMVRDARLHDASNGAPGPMPAVEMPTSLYLGQVAGFARAARDFYFLEPKQMPDDAFEADVHLAFWREYDRRLALAEQRP